MIDFTQTGWPPSRADIERLSRYEICKQLLEGDHKSAFADKSARLPDHLSSKSYLIADWPAMISKVSADMLFGEKPVFTLEDEAEQNELATWLKNSNAFTTFYESELTNSSHGDSVLRLRLGQIDNQNRVILEEIDPSYYFADLDPDNVRNVRGQCLAWVRTGPDEKTEYLRVEHHEPGRVINELYLLGDVVIPLFRSADQKPMTATSKKVLSRVPLTELYPVDPPPEEFMTGIPYSLLFHIPAFRSGCEYYGRTEYTPALQSLFDSYNNRLTKIDDILDRHVEPILAAPEGTLDENGQLKRNDLQVFEIGRNQDPNALHYVTWDGQLQAAFVELEKLADLIMKFSECSPAMFGEDKAGSIESGIAMKFRFARTESKAARKRNYWDPVLSRVVYVALLLSARWHGGLTPTAPPALTWKDGLPQNERETAEIETGLTTAKLSSRVESIMRIRQCDRKTAEAEIARIDAESPDPDPVPDLTPDPAPMMTPEQVSGP